MAEFMINIDTKRLTDLSGSMPYFIDDFIYGQKEPFNIYLSKESGSTWEPVTDSRLLTTVIGTMGTLSSSILFQDTHSLIGDVYTGEINVSGSAIKQQLYINSGSVDASFQVKSLDLVNSLTDVIYSGIVTIKQNII